MVLEQGKVVEFDTPEKLMELRGAFWRLVRESGLESGVGGWR